MSKDQDKKYLKDWFEDQVKKWKIATFVRNDKLSNTYHSNTTAEDVANFEEIVLNTLIDID
jgi:hypothetical protein